MPTNLNKLAKEIHENNVAHGWYDGTVSFTDKLLLMVCEIAEATEELRNGRAINEVYYVIDDDGLEKPEGAPVEIIDNIIRSLDALYKAGVDIDAVMNAKMAYNEHRPHMHGGKKF
jgi:hypothetical protein